MRRQDFHYSLPDELIARSPASERRASRMLVLDGESGRLQDEHFANLLYFLKPGDLLVFNDTRVIPARVFGQKPTGGKVEILVERVLDEQRVLAMLRASKTPSRIILENGMEVTVTGREGQFFYLQFPEGEAVLDVLEALGHMPLPPYIDRPDNEDDRERYQTVYGKNKGAVAAPTAGLHFDDAMLNALDEAGIERAFVTLHVGAGTFQPMRADNIHDHQMHSEWMHVSDEVCEKIRACKARGGRVIAVGTTSVRSLESAAASGSIQTYSGDTAIFIYPSYEFKVVDALITNFHLPESTLIMLVSAFAGYRHTMQAYEHAVAQQYRFFSYGDAMFITLNPLATQDQP